MLATKGVMSSLRTPHSAAPTFTTVLSMTKPWPPAMQWQSCRHLPISGKFIMAFNRNSNAARNESTSNDSWKAAGFLNFYLPTAEGGRRKLGAISLREKNANEKKLFEALKADPDLVSVIMNKLECEFRTAEASEGSAFDLG
jgi:hypothetical protein